MINIADFKAKVYQFQDGDKTITTKNPTQALYAKYLTFDTHNSDNNKMIELVDNTLYEVLYAEDAHYIDELPLNVKLILIRDYFDFHNKQVNTAPF